MPMQCTICQRLGRSYATILYAVLFFAVATVLLVLNFGGFLDGLGKKPQPQKTVSIDLGYATYQGVQLGNGVNQFLGMRYAAPPLADLRWRPPRDPPVETSIQDATKFGPICLATDGGASPVGQAEDCLYVNVWAPERASNTSKLPVWVFIQGGGYVSNSNSNWNGSRVIETSGNNIVFVNFNYRVGIWGFLAGKNVRENGALNVGLLDQRQLLLWVKKHISTFGGDPDHVVIHGLSAGAGSVALHLAAYGGRDDHLFVGAISESTFFPAQPEVPELEYQFNRTVQMAGCQNAGDIMACLRQQNQDTLQTANTAAPFPSRSGLPLFYWTPCIDGDLIRTVPYTQFESNSFIKVPIIFGTCTDEGSTFALNASSSADFTTWMQDQYPRMDNSTASQMLGHYPLMPALPNHDSWFPSTSLAYGEATFICPSNLVLDAYTRNGLGNQTWSWRFNVHDEMNTAIGIGVPHVFDAAAIFGPDMTPYIASYFTYNAPIVPIMMNYMISFIRNLNPNTYRDQLAPHWDNWGREESRVVLETGKTHMETVGEDQRSRCGFWKSTAQTLEQKI